MNGEGKESMEVRMEEGVIKERVVYMWGYLPGALPQRTPILSPITVRIPDTGGCSWTDVCGGGCGFAMAISDSGKLITWGSTEDLGQSYLTSGKHGEIPEPFPLPTDASIVKAAAGWAHCAAVTAAILPCLPNHFHCIISIFISISIFIENAEVYTWGWKECIPSGKVFGDSPMGTSLEKDAFERQNSFLADQASPRSQGSRSSGGSFSAADSKGGGEESTKRRRLSSAKQSAESSSSGDEARYAI